MNKYEKWYQSITKNGKISRNTGDEKHHIIPRSLGGTDEKSNIAYITPREHFLCHWLLTKIYPSGEEHWKMINAFRMMRAENPNQKRHTSKITARVYENLKKEYSILQSQQKAGENNPMYGDKFYRSENGKRRQREAIIGNKNGAKQEKAKQKISQSKIGKKRAPFTEEWRANLSIARQGERNGMYGKTQSEETRKKIGDRIRGRRQTEEEKARRGAANLGKTKPKKLCTHCNQLVAVNGYARWHGPRCKNQ